MSDSSSPPIPSLAAIRRIFSDALDLPPGEREAFIRSAAAGNAELARRVHELFATMTRAGGYLNAPPPTLARGDIDAIPAAASPRALVGTTIGPYKLVELIGEGGFGAVYLADQTDPIRRRVALKIIKAGMDSREVLARFDAERQALAMMDHPHIARVLDAGATPQGRPFFVMELVRGVPITSYCDQANLTPRQRLELLVPVCQAVQHAHQKGVIHRDIKPANVLVTLHDGAPVPKVIDFGIAKAVSGKLGDASVHTQLRAMLGTPAYMSPEQVSGLDVDTRIDVYALGVMMYELLTGSTPLDGKALVSAGLGEIHKLIHDSRPPKPSTRIAAAPAEVAVRRGADPVRLSRLLRGELDWIVMRAIEPDRTRRYDTAEALGADIRRHLRGEPVFARPPSALYLATTFARRNRVLMLATAAVALALVAGIVTSTLGFLAARRESALKDEALAAESRQRITARQIAYRASLAAATLAIENADSKLAAQSLDDAPEELRSWEWLHLQARADRSVFQVSLPNERGPGFSQAPEFLDGHLLATGGEGAPIRIYDFGKSELVSELPGGAARAFAVSDDRSRIAVVNTRGQLACFQAPWNAATSLWTLSGVSRLHPYAFTSDSKSLAVVREDGVTLALLDAITGRPLHQVTLADRIEFGPAYIAERHRFCVRAGPHHTWRAFSALDLQPTEDHLAIPAWVPVGRGRWLASDYLGRVSLSPPWNQEAVRWFAEPTPRRLYSSLQVTPAGEMAVVCDQSGGIVYWNIPRNEQLGCLLGAIGPARVSISDNGHWIGTTDSSGRIKVFSTAPGPWPFDIPCDGVDHRSDCVFSSSGRLGVASSWGVVEAWDPTSGERFWTRALSRAVVPALALSRDARLVACAAAGRGGRPFSPARAEFFVLDATTGQTLLHRKELGFVILGLEPAPGDSAGWLAACEDGVLRLLDADTGDVMRQSAPTSKLPTAIGRLRVADRAARAVSLSGVLYPARADPPRSEDAQVIVWDARDLTTERTLRCGNERAISVAISADGAVIAAITSDGVIRCWDSASGTERWSIHDQPIEAASLAFSPDTQRLAVAGSDGLLRLIAVATGQVTANLSGPWPLEQWRFVEDGRALVGGGIRVMSRMLETSRSEGTDTSLQLGEQRLTHVRAAATLQTSDVDPLALAADRAASLRADSSLAPDIREAAASRALCRADRPNYLNSTATSVVMRPGLPRVQYERAVSAMEAVCAQWPEDSSFANTLACAYYRCDRLDEAGTMFARSTALRRAAGQPAHPLDLLMLGATLIRQGRSVEGADQIRTGLDALVAQRLENDYEVRIWRDEAIAVATTAQIAIPPARNPESPR